MMSSQELQYATNLAAVIRDADERDLHALQDVFWRASMSNEGDRALLSAHPEFLELTAREIVAGRTRVVLDGDQTVGFSTTSTHDDRLELDSLFVHPDWMRHGLASALVRDAVDFARANGIAAIEVTGNDHARAFYDHAGFVAVGVEMTPGGVSAARLRLDIREEGAGR